MKNIENQATNAVTVTGTLLDVSMRDGMSKNNAPYRGGTATIRVNQRYGGKNEVSEVPISFIAMKFKSDGTINPAYESISQFASTFKSAQAVGLAEASRVTLRSKFGRLEENMFATQANPENVISTWRVSGNFFSAATSTEADCATFSEDIFIMAMDREISSAGEETGRLKIRGAIVRYGKKLDVVDFFVEDPTSVDYIERNWNVNDTVNAVGRIRYTSESVESNEVGSWGESIPQTTTKSKRELIITFGSDAPFDEMLAYDPADIRVLNQDRLNRKEQIKIDARARAAKPKAKSATASAPTDYAWME